MTQDIRYALIFLAETARQPQLRSGNSQAQISESHGLSLKFLEQVVGKLRQGRKFFMGYAWQEWRIRN